MAYRRTGDVIVAFCKGIWIPESGKFFIVESQRTLKYEKNISERLVRSLYFVHNAFGPKAKTLAWQNRLHLATIPLVFPQNDVWETSAEIPYRDASLPRSGECFWLVEINFSRRTTNQKYYPDMGSDASSVWNFCACFSDVIWRGNQW